MAPPNSKPSDAPEAPKPESKPEEHKNNLLSLMEGAKKNVLAPAVNSLAIEPVNAGANVVNGLMTAGTWAVNKVSGEQYTAPQFGKLTEMDQGQAEKGTAAAYTQQIVSTGSSFLAYAIAGKVMGKALRTTGELMPLEAEIKNLQIGHITRAVAQDSRVAMVLGATAYAGVRDTKDGESHLSNAVSTFVGFAAFEAGNSAVLNPRSSALMQASQRFTVGAIGGVAQGNAASLIQEHRLLTEKENFAAGTGGGFLNALIPTGNKILEENPVAKFTPHANEAAKSLHVEAARALPKGATPEPGSWADPASIKALSKAARADLNMKLKVDAAPGNTHINQKENVIHVAKGDDPLNVLQEMAHRRIAKDPKYEAEFRDQASRLQSTDPADAGNAAVKEQYIQTRLNQEIAARTAQNEEAAKLGAPRRVSVDATEIRDKEGYGARFEQEANQFIASGGKTRPEIDHAGPGGGHGGGHSADHVVNTVSTAHAEADHGPGAHADGPGGGHETERDTARTAEERAALDRDLEAWPDVQDLQKQTGTSWEATSEDNPTPRQFHWYSYPEGVSFHGRFEGNDNVIWAAHYGPNLDEVVLVSRDPITKALSAKKYFADPEYAADNTGRMFSSHSIKKTFDRSANGTDFHDLFNSEQGLRATSYDIAEGNDLLPSNTTFTTFTKPQVYDLGGEKIFPSSMLEYHDANGRVDYHQDYPFETTITEYEKPIETEGGIRFKVAIPQNTPNSWRLFRLTADGRPDGFTDVFTEEHPLETSFGKVLQVDRLGNKDLYHMEDGSAVMMIHRDGKIVKEHWVNGRLESTKNLKKDAGYDEIYSPPWRSIFGLADKVTVTPTKAVYHLESGGTVNHFKEPTTYGHFENVEWVYEDPNGDKTLQLSDGAHTRVRIPVDGVKTGVTAFPDAIGVQIVPGLGGFNRYYFEGGEHFDVSPDRPGVGVYRGEGVVTEIGNGPNGWTIVSHYFNKGQLPTVEITDARTGVREIQLPMEKCFDDHKNPIPVITEVYKSGLMTKWGLALERQTFWSGSSKLRISDGAKGIREIDLDAAGNMIQRDAAGNQIGIIPEPKDFPSLRGVASPRRIVNSKDFAPRTVNMPGDEAPAAPYDDSAWEEAPPDEDHHESDDDKLDVDDP
ncbi:MAG TPA: hypothetical protein V6C86_04130 [Oculatellaceae cyanobacterium]